MLNAASHRLWLKIIEYEDSYNCQSSNIIMQMPTFLPPKCPYYGYHTARAYTLISQDQARLF